MKRLRTLILLVFGVSLLLSAQSLPKHIQKLLNAQMAVSRFYVDSVNDDKLVDDAIRGMLEKLDPHSTYTDAEETKELNEPLQGKFSGIGIQFNLQKDTVYVIQTVVGGPCERLGVLAGDRIITVNDTVIAGKKMKNKDIMKRLRGPKGSVANLGVLRRGEPELIHFRVVREDIPIYSVDASYMVGKDIGYVKISRFGAETHDEMKAALDSLKKQGMKKIILDLADNGGGYLNSAIEIANEFLDKSNLIVYTEGENAPRSDASAKGNGNYKNYDVAVVVNQYSASASEILSGALQDWDRAVIVGRRTFGKGLVQRPFEFNDGSMMRLTVARYHTPSGRCIQKPYSKGDKESYEKDILNRFNDGELYRTDSIHFADSLKVSTLKNHRTIYGGGGIMPDLFVPLDTTELTKYYRTLVAKGTLNNFVIAFVDKNRNEIKKSFPTLKDYKEGYNVTDNLLRDLVAKGESDSIKLDSVQYKLSENLLRNQVKALVARDVYTDRSAYYYIINDSNDLVKRAIDVLNDKRRYDAILSGKPTIKEKAYGKRK